MDALTTHIRPDDPQIQTNHTHHRALADELRQRMSRAREGGSPARRQRHESRGKLFVREQIDRLLDSGAPFLEIGPLAPWDSFDGEASGAGMVGRMRDPNLQQWIW